MSSITKKNGFTLVELMVVCMILAVLTAVGLPRYNRYRARGRQTEARDKLANLKGVEDSFYGMYGVYAGCYGSMGLEWTSGWYGISKAQVALADGVNYNAIARGKGAICPDSDPNPGGKEYFPVSKSGSGCDSFYLAGNYGVITTTTGNSVGVEIVGFPITCVGNFFSPEWEHWDLEGNANTSLQIVGPWAINPGWIAVPYPTP